MDDVHFQSWMRRMAAVDEAGHPHKADQIWWRAQLRQRLNVEKLSTRPIRIAEGAAGLVCWALAAVVSAGIGTGGLVVLLTVTLAVIGGLRAIAPRKT
jgi:hypothetical protein